MGRQPKLEQSQQHHHHHPHLLRRRHRQRHRRHQLRHWHPTRVCLLLPRRDLLRNSARFDEETFKLLFVLFFFCRFHLVVCSTDIILFCIPIIQSLSRFRSFPHFQSFSCLFFNFAPSISLPPVTRSRTTQHTSTVTCMDLHAATGILVTGAADGSVALMQLGDSSQVCANQTHSCVDTNYYNLSG